MYQSKLHTEHNKNLLASVCLGMLWLLCARVWKWGCECVWVGVCVCVLCLSANPLTLRVVNLPTLRRVNLFLLLCRRVEGLSSAFALSMGGNRGRLGGGGGVVRIVKPHVWQHVWHTITRAAERKATFVTQNKMAVRPFSLISSWGRSSPFPFPRSRLAPSHGLLYSRFSCAHTEREL